jgi:hypothetical protein
MLLLRVLLINRVWHVIAIFQNKNEHRTSKEFRSKRNFKVDSIHLFSLQVDRDVANGIIFFIGQHMNIHYLIMVAILFTVTNLVGQKNGKEVLILRRNFFITPFKYGLLTIWIVLAYGTVVGLLRVNEKGAMNTFEMIQTYILKPYLQTTLVLLVPLAIYSYFCGDRIKKGIIGIEKN